MLIWALLSWLIGKALSWFWNWLNITHNAPQLVCDLVT